MKCGKYEVLWHTTISGFLSWESWAWTFALSNALKPDHLLSKSDIFLVNPRPCPNPRESKPAELYSSQDTCLEYFRVLFKTLSCPDMAGTWAYSSLVTGGARTLCAARSVCLRGVNSSLPAVGYCRGWVFGALWAKEVCMEVHGLCCLPTSWYSRCLPYDRTLIVWWARPMQGILLGPAGLYERFLRAGNKGGRRALAHCWGMCLLHSEAPAGLGFCRGLTPGSS